MDDERARLTPGPYVGILDTDNEEIRIVSEVADGKVLARIPAPIDTNDPSRIDSTAASNATLMQCSWEMKQALTSMLQGKDQAMDEDLALSASHLLDQIDRGGEGYQFLRSLRWLEKEASPSERRGWLREAGLEIPDDAEEDANPAHGW